MEAIPYLACYVGFFVFVVAVGCRIVRWLRLPLHLRWELYPVAHEPRGRERYGGSFMEQAEWWKKPRDTSMLGELEVMLPEMLWLSGVRRHNRPLWRWSFPFHFGLYLTTAVVAAALLAGVAEALRPGILAGSAGAVVRGAMVALGVAGLCLGVGGALGLLYRRLTEPGMRAYTVPADLMNLAFFVVTFGWGLVTCALVDRDGSRALAFASRLVRFELTALPGEGLDVVLPAVTAVLFSALVAYVPLTHMSHFVAKLFGYHAIRWNDEPNLRGGPHERRIEELLAHEVGWAAAHISGERKRTWRDLAQEGPGEGR